MKKLRKTFGFRFSRLRSNLSLFSATYQVNGKFPIGLFSPDLNSIAETAKANNLKPYQYFEYLLAELPKRIEQPMTAEFSLKDLMP